MSKYSMSGWMDEILPNLDEVLSDISCDKTGFLQWLSKELGRYRLDRDHPFPNAETEKKELKKFIKLLEAIEPYMQYGGLPPVVSHKIWEKFYESWLHWNFDNKRDEVYKDILRMRVIAQQVEQEIKNATSPKGRPRKGRRDSLLNGLIDRLVELGIAITIAREKAEHILILCGIDVPEGERSIRRAINNRINKGGQKKEKV